MKEDNKSYRSAFLSIGIFGGMQVAVILISVIKNKLLATWIGVEGFGIQNLLLSSLNLFFIISNLGLSSSSVREIASSLDNNELLSAKVSSIRWWNRSLGIIGSITMLAMSPFLGKWVFGDISKWYWFAILSPCILFMNVYNGSYSILQGLRKVKLLAKSSIAGAVLGFVCSMPIFYFWKLDGIVPALIVLQLTTLAISLYLFRKANVPLCNNTTKKNYNIGLSALKLGIALSINSIFVEFTAFLIKLFVSNYGGVEEVGLFQAGWAINASYISVVFTAMAKDYLPRLSQVASDNNKVYQMIKQQGVMSILILLPLLAIMIVFVQLVVKILYTEEFMSITTMTICLLLGSLIKSASWSIAYVFIAKADKKAFLFNEILTRVIVVPFYIIGYYFLGLNGLGVAFLAEHVVYFIWIGVSSYRLYGFSYDKEFWTIFGLSFSILIFLSLQQIYHQNNNMLSIVLLFVAILFSLYMVNKKINLLKILKRDK